MNEQKILEDLQFRGIAMTGVMSDVDKFAEILRPTSRFSGHVIAHGDGIPRTGEETIGFDVLSHQMQDVLRIPPFFNYAVKFTPLIEKFFSEKPLMYSFNAFWTRAGVEPPNPHIQQWHRDRDDRKFVALFLYGTDVTADNGAHYYVTGSHRTLDDGNRAPVAYEDVQCVTGPAGTTFLECARGLHMGMKPSKGERLLAWARWGVSENPVAYVNDKTTPVPASELGFSGYSDAVKASTRLIVDWSK